MDAPTVAFVVYCAVLIVTMILGARILFGRWGLF